MAADPEFVRQTAAIAIAEAEEQLIQATRAYEDASRYGDPQSGSQALSEYATAKARLDILQANNQQQQNTGRQLSEPARRFLQKRIDAGEELTPARWQEMQKAHSAAIGAGYEPDSSSYFQVIERHLASVGLGQPPLDATEAARISGLSPNEYNQQARKFAALKARGYFTDQ